MAVVIPVTAAALYAWLGNWQVGMYGVSAAARTEVETMVASLAHRLKTTDQNDLKGWIMLGRSYLAMSRYAEAVQVFAQARRIAGDQNAEVLASYGEALVLADPTNLISKAAPLFEKALKEQPDNIKALWYSGLAALAQRNSALAISRWRKLLVLDLPPDYRKAVEDRIRAAGGTVAPVTARSSARL
jgi:cytochrome c-type biogenesis protein CcmH